MSKIQVFLADTEAVHIEKLRKVLCRHRDLEVVGFAGDGSTALKCLMQQTVDVLILDPQLPGMDGFILLNDLKRMNRCPTSIICTHLCTELCTELARRVGASYVLYKPLDYKRMPEIVLACQRLKERNGPSVPRDEVSCVRTIRRQLNILGFPPSLNGSLYLTDALVRLHGDTSLLHNLSKGLYAEIGAAFNTTPVRIERALRNAIGIAFARGGLAQRFDHRPRNRELFEYMLERMDEEWID